VKKASQSVPTLSYRPHRANIHSEDADKDATAALPAGDPPADVVCPSESIHILLGPPSYPRSSTAMAQATQKVVILLTKSKDWDEWYEVIQSTAIRKDVFPLINAAKAEAPSSLEKP
jgi:hypothetical protein